MDSFDEKCKNDIVELSKFLNKLPERDKANGQLLNPINIDDLFWDDFQEELAVSQRSIRLFKRKLNYLVPKSRRHQIYCYYEMLQYDPLLQPSSIKLALAFLFGIKKENIASMISSYKNYVDNHESIPSKGRPPTLSDEQINQIKLTISEKEKLYQPMSQTEVVNHIFDVYGKLVSKKWVKRLVNSIDELSFTDAEPLNVLRTTVTKEQIKNYFSAVEESIEKVHPDLVYNVDEIGFARKLNGKKKKCIIFSQKDMDRNRRVFFNQPTDDLQNFTLIACVTLSGERVKPMMICPVKSCSIEFLTNAIWPGKDCIFGFSESGYNSTYLFKTWFENTFLPDLNERRRKLNEDAENRKFSKWAVLICDGFLGHDGEFVKSLAAQYFVKIIFLPAHSSHILQALDKYVFAIMKRIYYSKVKIKDARDRNGKKILKILYSFYNSTNPMLIRASFKAIGIICRWEDSGKFHSIYINSNDIIKNHQEKHNLKPNLNEKTKKRKRAELVQKKRFLSK